MMHWLAHKLGLKRCPDCDILVDYAMDGLPDSQQEKVRRHLDGCPPCREQVRDFWQVREGLGLCAHQQDAPADLCAKVLARLDDPCGAQARAPEGGPSRHGWASFWMRLGPAFALLSLVMTALAMTALLRVQGPSPDHGGAALARAAVGGPGAVRIVLGGGGSAPAAGGLLVLRPGVDRAYLRCALPRSPWGSDYVLWMSEGGHRPKALCRFTVDRGGGSVQVLQLAGAFRGRGAVAFMVTRPRRRGAVGRPWLAGKARL